MNAAFLLLTTVCLANGHAPVAGACDGGCNTGCDTSCYDPCGGCKGPGILDRLRGLFHKNNCCDSCAPTTCAPVCQPCPAPKCEPVCDPCRPRFHFNFNFHRKCDCAPACEPVCAPAPKCAPVCAPAPKCETSCGCGDPCGCKPSILDRLRGMFHRSNDCCNTCDPCAQGSFGTVVPSPEPVAPPKKMPTASSSVRIDNVVPAPVPNVAPAIEGTPAVIPSIDFDNRN